MLNKLLVDMPNTRVYKQKRYKDKKYVYFTIKAYRNDKGKPTSDALMIGVEDGETGKLIPNQNFFKVYDCNITVKVNGINNNYK